LNARKLRTNFPFTTIVFDDGEKITYPPYGYLTWSWSRNYYLHIKADGSIDFTNKDGGDIVNKVPDKSSKKWLIPNCNLKDSNDKRNFEN
jgi:hypothetical protein